MLVGHWLSHHMYLPFLVSQFLFLISSFLLLGWPAFRRLQYGEPGNEATTILFSPLLLASEWVSTFCSIHTMVGSYHAKPYSALSISWQSISKSITLERMSQYSPPHTLRREWVRTLLHTHSGGNESVLSSTHTQEAMFCHRCKCFTAKDM